jgi:endonuclease VIII
VPEGPEIYRAAQALDQAVARKPIRLKLIHPALSRMARTLRGATISRVYARSKAMLTEFDNGHVLYSHNQLYGEWVLHDADDALLPRQARLIVEAADTCAVLYSATEFAWLKAGNEDKHPYLAKLGPEVLSDEVSAQAIARRLREFPRRVIADALLDQHVIAGLGNYLRADILHVARVNPLDKIAALSDASVLRIARACKTLTRRSVNQEGVVRPMAAYRAARRSEQRPSQKNKQNPKQKTPLKPFNEATHQAAHEAARFYVFDREGKACWTCGAAIRRVNSGGRGLFFCAHCQSV